jgi:hypothetical protein
VIDATSGEPLAGSPPSFAFVVLLRCDEFGECEDVADQSTDDEGGFRFERDFDDQPLVAGTYQVVAFAENFEDGATEPFDVGEDEEVDIGDLALAPLPVVVSDFESCESLLPAGGTCRYSVTLRNNTDALFQGLAWSVVEGFNLPSGLGFSLFEASTVRGSGLAAVRAPVSLDPSGQQTVRFRLRVPALGPDVEFCTSIFVGEDPAPLVTTVLQDFLFCVSGTDDGLAMVSARSTRKLVGSLRQKSLRAGKLLRN